VYGKTNNDLYVNLFISSNTTLNMNKREIQVVQENNYPWDGDLTFRINPTSPVAFNLKLRIPGWASNQAMPSDLYIFETNSDKKITLKINGKSTDFAMDKGYAVVSRIWKKGDVVELVLPMEVRRVKANKNVKDDIGKVALQRGPLMYCAEWPDNNDRVSNLILPATATFSSEFKPDLLHGVTVIKSEASAVLIDPSGNSVSSVKQEFTAIPYYAWAHRGKGEMVVWIPERVKEIDLMPGD